VRQAELGVGEYVLLAVIRRVATGDERSMLRRAYLRATTRPHLEALEARDLLSVSGAAVLPADPSDTLLGAVGLGGLTPKPLQVAGVIGDSPAAGADVDWYSFTLDAPAHVTLTSSSGVLSLYNNDPANISDPFNFLGHRLLGQGVPRGRAETRLEQDLAA